MTNDGQMTARSASEASIAACLNLIEAYEREIAACDRELLANVRDMSFADPADKLKARGYLVGRRGDAILVCAALRVRVRGLRLALEELEQ